MSNFIQLEQPFGRIDPDSPRAYVDIDANVLGKRNQYLATLTPHHKPAAAGAALDAADEPHLGASRRFNHAADELMLVVATRPERKEQRFRHSKLQPRQPFDRLDARQPFETNHRTAVLHPRGRNR